MRRQVDLPWLKRSTEETGSHLGVLTYVKPSPRRLMRSQGKKFFQPSVPYADYLLAHPTYFYSAMSISTPLGSDSACFPKGQSSINFRVISPKDR